MDLSGSGGNKIGNKAKPEIHSIQKLKKVADRTESNKITYSFRCV